MLCSCFVLLYFMDHHLPFSIIAADVAVDGSECFCGWELDLAAAFIVLKPPAAQNTTAIARLLIFHHELLMHLCIIHSVNQVETAPSNPGSTDQQQNSKMHATTTRTSAPAGLCHFSYSNYIRFFIAAVSKQHNAAQQLHSPLSANQQMAY
ncbi:hypothetical protein Nepgr_030040 [Nepenthes gracilis]|uniref:Secreted protein n=1 Tax=Nepenthes gracilis TaxID=150966 RepID=A0AAD3Y3K2_NEPGR|nr:hypothetical protein Nepgr_030040 [Nepenthes gracilis]